MYACKLKPSTKRNLEAFRRANRKRAVRLLFGRGMSNAEIARKLRTPYSTIRRDAIEYEAECSAHYTSNDKLTGAGGETRKDSR